MNVNIKSSSYSIKSLFLIIDFYKFLQYNKIRNKKFVSKYLKRGACCNIATKIYI